MKFLELIILLITVSYALAAVPGCREGCYVCDLQAPRCAFVDKIKSKYNIPDDEMAEALLQYSGD